MSTLGVREYVEQLALRLGPAAPPELVQLKNAATALQHAIDNPGSVTRPQWDALVHEFEVRRDALKQQLTEAVLKGLPIAEAKALLKRADWNAPEGFSAAPALGPLSVELSCAPHGVRYPGAVPGPFTPLLPQLPNRIRGTLNAGPVKGGGVLELLADENEVRGALGLRLTALEVGALGSLKDAAGTPSFLAVLGVGFVPGIQLGFGFSLARIGGLVGVNRTADTDVLAARLRGGTAMDVLFATDPLRDYRRLLPALSEMFPPKAGHHLAGPTLRIGWLQVDQAALFNVDIGVIIELPGPARVIIAGSARAELPGTPKLLRLRIDILGVLDFARRTIAFDATLVDSGALGIFVITGDAAFRLGYGDRQYMLLSIGGFYPGFQPEPNTLPPLHRIALALQSPLPLPLTLRAEGYFAVTSNTLQLGARIDASFNAGLSAVGSLGLDALIQFTPFHFEAEFFAGFRVEVAGFTFGGVRLEGTISGPGPIVISGRLTIETFLIDFSWHETFTLPGGGGKASSPPISLLQALRRELEAPENLHALAGPDPSVTLRPRPGSGPRAAVSPTGEAAWSQRRAPLGIKLDRLEGAPLGAPQGVRFAGPASRAVRALFSPGSFATLSQAEALNRPAFEELDGGAVLAWPTQLDPSAAGVATQPGGMKVYVAVGHHDQPTPLPEAAFQLAPAHVLDLLGDRLRAAAVTDTTPKVSVDGSETWRWSGSPGDAYDSATAAHQQARYAGGIALAREDFDRPASVGGL